MRRVLYIVVLLFILASCKQEASSGPDVMHMCESQIKRILRDGTDFEIERISESKMMLYPKGYGLYTDPFDSVNIAQAAATIFLKDKYTNANSYYLKSLSKAKSDSIMSEANKVLSLVSFKHIGYKYIVSGYATHENTRVYFDCHLYSDLRKTKFSANQNDDMYYQIIQEMIPKDSLHFYIDRINNLDSDKHVRIDFDLQ